MALSDIYQVVDYQRLPSGERIENVYFYRASGPDGAADDLVTAFIAGVRDKVLAVQSNQLVHSLLRVTNLGDVADFAENNTSGIVGDNALPVRNEWDCFAYTLRPSTRAVRPGSKRIGGVFEQDASYTNGVVTDTDVLIACNALRTELGAVQVGTEDSYIPVIIKRVLDGGSYRLPETDEELVAIDVAVVLFNPKISHQVTRGNSR